MSISQTFQKYLVILLASIILTACGGGGGGGGSTGTSTSTSGSSGSSSSGFTNTTPSNYVWDTLQAGKMMFIDRDYVLDAPSSTYAGLDYLRTAKNDSSSTGNSFISFTTDVVSTVYVAHHNAITTKPSWLSSWTDTGDDYHNRSIYKKTFSAGNITLGGNTVDGANAGSMYFVMVDRNTKALVAKLSWGAPTTKEDGSSISLSDLDGYRIYFGETIDSITAVSDINDATATSYDYVLAGLSPGTYYISVTAYDIYGKESDFSGISSIVIN